ncbi:MAG: response regulator transcription factor [Chloroflexi bacterium]|nr:response regulator transcription factor [Chloroflexota bacterium]
MPTTLDENESPLFQEEPISVLIVDHNLSFLGVTKMFLEANCRQDIDVVLTASDGKEAIAQAQAHHPQLILLDVSLPGMTGMETALQIKKILPQSHIILLTLIETLGYQQAAQAAGADTLLDKSNLDTELLPSIQRLLHG